MKKSNQGFTLIELIIVIVILGILAVTAAPRFLDLAGDARVSVIEGMRGSVQGAASIVNSRAIIQNQLGGTGFIDEDNDGVNDGLAAGEIQLVNGFPDAASLAQTLDLTAGDWQVVAGATIVRIYPNDVTAHTVSGDTFADPSNATADQCFLQYTEATAGNRPALGPLQGNNSTVTGC